jgi:transposase InsO family protein
MNWPGFDGDREGVVYFSFVIDVFSRMLIGWQLASNVRATLVLDALRISSRSSVVSRSARR